MVTSPWWIAPSLKVIADNLCKCHLRLHMMKHHDDGDQPLGCTLLKSYSWQLVQVSVSAKLFTPHCHIALARPNVQPLW